MIFARDAGHSLIYLIPASHVIAIFLSIMMYFINVCALQEEEESALSDMERMTLLQRAATAEEGAKQAETRVQILSEEKATLQAKLETMNKQLQRLEEWHRLMVVDAQQTPTGEGAPQEKVESTEDLSHDEALREIQKQKTIISELKNRVASLQTKMGTFEKTAAENSKMEQHGKEQSKVVMEWRQRCEVAEVMTDR